MDFIEVLKAERNFRGQTNEIPSLLNSDHIIRFGQKGAVTEIVLSDDSAINVSDTVSQIEDKLSGGPIRTRPRTRD